MTSSITSPLKAIRQNCLECNGTAQEVKLCPCTDCPMYPFRFGTNPFRKKREMTEEQREAASKRLADARAKKG